MARTSRRELLKLASFLGASLIRPEAARGAQALMYFNAYPFTLGVASGDPVPDGVVLWTRLAPRAARRRRDADGAVPVQWEVAGRGIPHVAQKGETLARPEFGHSVHVEVAGLEPAREYWYRFRAGNESQPDRPHADGACGWRGGRSSCGSAVCGCSHYETGYFTGYRRIAQEQFDFVIHTGDYIYESRADGGRNENRVRQHPGR